MSKDTPLSGLLSRMAKFVKNSATGWSDLDRLDSARPSEGSARQALKEMIERKRHNDAARREEFSMLRKVRRSAAGGLPPLPAVEDYVSSLPYGIERPQGSHTLRHKINQLEEQMAQGWLDKGRSPAPSPSPRPAAAAPAPTPAQLAPTRPQEDSRSFANTQPLSDLAGVTDALLAIDTDTLPDNPDTLVEAILTTQGQRDQVDDYTFGLAGNFNVEVSADMAQDPELQEAAIRFANGDVGGAEESLKALLALGGSRESHTETWLCLFDLYRASAQQGRFDDLAIEFASRFGRSAPQWGMLTPDELRQMEQISAAVQNQGSARTTLAQWTSPSAISVQSMTTLAGALKRGSPPWRVDWRATKSISLDALPALTKQLTDWANKEDRIKFLGVESLLAVLADKTPTEDREVDQQWWMARLALLRLLGEMDEFDLVALNYCVTYEVSPPAWEEPRCRFTAMTPEGETVLGEMDPAAKAADTREPHQAASDMKVVDGVLKTTLRGDLLDDPAPVLAPLAEPLAKARSIEFNCRFLLRVDFSAAGMLLNWASERKNEKKPVTFSNLNRMVAVFFGVMGLNEVARVLPRKD